MSRVKKRGTTVPKAVREQVLREFNHQCAICGSGNPHLHHIDGDRSNHDPMNLLPLCPNCHLGDQHNPTGKVDQEKLKLFRRFKDPTILDERFHPLWIRMRFLLDLEKRQLNDLKTRAEELFHFVDSLTMGDFYGRQLRSLIKAPVYAGVWSTESAFRQRQNEEIKEYRDLLTRNRERVFELIVELLRYQNWTKKKG
jgi:hypothetical protein